MILSDMARSDLQWWIENITDTSNTATHGNCQVTVYSDASLTGWGGVVVLKSYFAHFSLLIIEGIIKKTHGI